MMPSHGGPWQTVLDAENVPHVLPSYGPRHELTMNCWCHPVVDKDYTEAAVSHNVAQ